MSQREEAEEEGVRPTETPLCGQPESQTGAQSPEQQRPESAGLRMNVEDNVSTESLPELSNLDIVWCPPYPFDPLADEETIDDVISPLDPKGSLADYCPSSEDRMRMAEDDDDDNLVQSSNSLSRTSSGYSSASSLSFKSDWSKDNIIDFKGGSATLMSDYSPSSEEEEGAADDDVVQPSNRLPELQRPESAGRRMTGRRTRSTDRLGSNDIWAILKLLLEEIMSLIHDFKEGSNLTPELQRPESAGRRMTGKKNRSTDRLLSRRQSRTSSRYSSTSKLYFKSDGSKDDSMVFRGRRSSLRKRLKRTRSMGPILDFIEHSNRSPELQRPESAGRRMTVEDIWSTFWHRFLPIHSRRQDSLKKSSMCPFPDFKESSNLSPELQRPESAGLKMTVEDIWSTFWHRFLPIHSLPKSPTSSEDSFTSGQSFKSDESKDNTIIDFKEGCSTLIPEQQRPESAGLRMNEWRTRSTDRLLSRRQSRTSSRYSSKSKLYFKSDGSKDDSMVFRGRRSSLSRTRQMSREKSKEYTLDF